MPTFPCSTLISSLTLLTCPQREEERKIYPKLNNLQPVQTMVSRFHASAGLMGAVGTSRTHGSQRQGLHGLVAGMSSVAYRSAEVKAASPLRDVPVYEEAVVMQPLESDTVCGGWFWCRQALFHRVLAVTLEQHGESLLQFTQWFERRTLHLQGEFFALIDTYRQAQ